MSVIFPAGVATESIRVAKYRRNPRDLRITYRRKRRIVEPAFDRRFGLMIEDFIGKITQILLPGQRIKLFGSHLCPQGHGPPKQNKQ